MRTSVILLAFLPFVIGGYIPPENNDYDNHSYNSCTCDDKLATLSSRLDRLERHNSELLQRKKRWIEGQPIAFTAYLSHNSNVMQIGQPVVFDQFLVNEGQAYDPASGKFTAPTGGLYMFSFIIETKHSVDTAVQLVVDGVNQLDAVVEPRHTEQNVQGGNVGVLKLQTGQQVWVKVYNSGGQTMEGGDIYRFTTFTGVLLYEIESDSPSVIGK